MRVEGERAQVLITVKATPQPSSSYGDTSCVAGVRIDGDEPTWIRLYPIAFRWLDAESQFKKYDSVELEVRRRDADTRSESYSPAQDSWEVINHLRPGKSRHQVIRRLPVTTTCELMSAASANPAATSLGLIYPADVDRLEFEPHPLPLPLREHWLPRTPRPNSRLGADGATEPTPPPRRRREGRGYGEVSGPDVRD